MSTGAPEVPRELVGREVSCRTLTVCFEELEARGLSETCLTDGVGVPAAILRDPRQRISWDVFRAVLARARELWSDDELVALGRRIPRTRWLRPLAALARLR